MLFLTILPSHRKASPPSPSTSTLRSSSDLSEAPTESSWFDEDKQGLHDLSRVLEGAEKVRRRISSYSTGTSSPVPSKKGDRSQSSLDIRVESESIVVVDHPSGSSPNCKRPLSVRFDEATSHIVRLLTQSPQTSLAPEATATPSRQGIAYHASPSTVQLEQESFLHLSKPSNPILSFFSSSSRSKSTPSRVPTRSPQKKKPTAANRKPW